MKQTRWIVLLAVAVVAQQIRAEEPWEDSFSRLLGRYVTSDGVRYAEWKANPADVAALKKVTEAIGRNGPGSQERDVALAYYINAYNALILDGVLQRYPIKSVTDIAPLFGFFFLNQITVAGKRTSFDGLEKGIIIARFHEPRIHFAINCASRSCPPLRTAAYRSATLDAELNQSAAAFVSSNPRGVKEENGVYRLSKIFDWYKKDFASAGGPVSFINRFRQPPIPGNAKIAGQDYDWSLNEAK